MDFLYCISRAEHNVQKKIVFFAAITLHQKLNSAGIGNFFTSSLFTAAAAGDKATCNHNTTRRPCGPRFSAAITATKIVCIVFRCDRTYSILNIRWIVLIRVQRRFHFFYPFFILLVAVCTFRWGKFAVEQDRLLSWLHFRSLYDKNLHHELSIDSPHETMYQNSNFLISLYCTKPHWE